MLARLRLSNYSFDLLVFFVYEPTSPRKQQRTDLVPWVVPFWLVVPTVPKESTSPFDDAPKAPKAPKAAKGGKQHATSTRT